MGILFRTRYDDSRLLAAAEQALNNDPAVRINQLEVESRHGVLTLRGRAANSYSKRHAVALVAAALKRAELKCANIVDEVSWTLG